MSNGAVQETDGLSWHRNLPRMALVYGAAVLGGFLGAWLHIPLPWMIGPLILSAAFGIGGFKVSIPVLTRKVGQTVVAAVVGLSFTPLALAAVREQLVAMVAVAALTILAGFVAAAVLVRFGRTDVVSASLASIPGGPVEMASLAARHGVPPGPVALAQTLRIVLLVLTFPPVLVALEGRVVDAQALLGGFPVDHAGAALLLCMAGLAGLGCRLVRLTNPYFLGPLACSAGASALVLPVAMPPYWLLATAQILLGVWLGRMLDRRLLTTARGFLPAVLASTLALLVVCIAMAFLVSHLAGIDWRTMLLATAPGSVTEMALTAKLLGQDVATVTAFHIIRIFIIVPTAPILFALTARAAEHFRGKHE
jgi:membrane AbrB-like protein